MEYDRRRQIEEAPLRLNECVLRIGVELGETTRALKRIEDVLQRVVDAIYILR